MATAPFGLTHSLRSALPRGNTLPAESWHARHRVILAIAVVHVLGVATYGVARGYGVLHCSLEVSAIAALTVCAAWAGHLDRRRTASCAASLALLTSSALVVHLSGGATEAHFHFFVVVVVLTLYEDWVPFLVALGYVVVHHGLMGVLHPGSIYSDSTMSTRPWLALAVHGGFVAAAGAAGVSAWKHSETARDRALDAEREASQLHRSVVETLSEGVMLIGPDGDIRSANPSVGRMYGVTEEWLVGHNCFDHARATTREDGQPWDSSQYPAAHTARTGEEVRGAIVGHLGTEGETRWIEINTRPLRREGEGWSVVASMVDVTDRKAAESELQRLADRDALTGLLNRRSLERVLERDLAQAARHDHGTAVLMLDLDNFKYLNDSLGHGVGDQMICAAAEAISARVRRSDTAARLGGDEFAVVLNHTNGPDAEALALDLTKAIREDVVVETEDGPRRTTASVGVALVAAGDTVTEVMAHADMAMYRAKGHGKDRVSLFDPGQDRQAEARLGLSWAERIRTGLQEDRFLLHAQPIKSLDGVDGIRRFELLVRMLDEEGATVPPGVFLPVAERFHLIADIDRWVLRRAARILGDLAHRQVDNVELSINLSASSIDIEMLHVLQDALQETGGDPRRLTVEITETAAIADLERAKAFALGLRAMGCRLSLDDFGAGFASFHYLKHLDFDEIKIDGEYVADMPESQTHRMVVRSLVDLAHGLGKEVTAEFVGCDETVRLLDGFGVRWGQGFHLGRPDELAQHGIVPPESEIAAGEPLPA